MEKFVFDRFKRSYNEETNNQNMEATRIFLSRGCQSSIRDETGGRAVGRGETEEMSEQIWQNQQRETYTSRNSSRNFPTFTKSGSKSARPAGHPGSQ